MATMLPTGMLPGLLSPEQEAAVRQQAQQNALLNFGLQALAGSQAVGYKPGTLQVLGQAGQSGLQAYQGTFDQQLQNMLRQQQLADAQRKRQQQERFRQALEGARTTRVSPTLGLGAQQVESPITRAELEAFGPQGYMEAASTVAPTETVIDRNKMLAAIAEIDPQKYLELTQAPEATSEVRTLQALLADPKLLEGYLQIESAKAPRTTNIFRDGKAEQALFEKVTVPRIERFASAADSARRFARTSATINNLLKGQGGGEVVKIGTELAGALGIKSDQIARQDLANSLVVQLAPQMRAPGSGSTSDIEFKSYIAAVPSLSSSELGREIMTRSAEAFATRNEKLADYAEKLAKEGRLTFEAMAEYDRNLGPVLGNDFYNFVRGTQPRPASGGVIDFRNGQGGPF